MKLPLCSLLAFSACGMLFAADEKPAAVFKDARDKTSYSLGVNIGTSMKTQGADINIDEVTAGLRDALGGKAKLTDAEVRDTLRAWQTELRAKYMEKQKAEGEQGRKAEIGRAHV